MYTRLPHDSSFYQLLLKIDVELLEKFHRKPCAHCGSHLDRADYQRKPRGLSGCTEKFNTRFSLCCRQEGCRKRVCPPSLRFFGRRVWSAPVFMVASILAGDHSQKTLITFCKALGVHMKTIGLWRRWWSDIYVASKHWRHLKGLFSRQVDEPGLPSSLLPLCSHQTDIQKKMIWLLRLFTTSII